MNQQQPPPQFAPPPQFVPMQPGGGNVLPRPAGPSPQQQQQQQGVGNNNAPAGHQPNAGGGQQQQHQPPSPPQQVFQVAVIDTPNGPQQVMIPVQNQAGMPRAGGAPPVFMPHGPPGTSPPGGMIQLTPPGMPLMQHQQPQMIMGPNGQPMMVIPSPPQQQLATPPPQMMMVMPPGGGAPIMVPMQQQPQQQQQQMPPGAAPPSVPGHNPAVPHIPCRDYRVGRCSRGDQCRFGHFIPAIPVPPLNRGARTNSQSSSNASSVRSVPVEPLAAGAGPGAVLGSSASGAVGSGYIVGGSGGFVGNGSSLLQKPSPQGSAHGTPDSNTLTPPLNNDSMGLGAGAAGSTPTGALGSSGNNVIGESNSGSPLLSAGTQSLSGSSSGTHHQQQQQQQPEPVSEQALADLVAAVSGGDHE